MRKINGKDISDFNSFLMEKGHCFILLTDKAVQWIHGNPSYLKEPNRERVVLPIGELPRYYMDSDELRYIDDWDDNPYASQFCDYALFEGFDANTVTVGKHGDLDVRVCTDGSVVMLG